MIIVKCDCKLCCKGKLPGVESHLFSEFLIKETINRPGKANATGKNSKGNELLFGLSPYENARLFVGRHSTNAALEALGREEFTDEEAANLQETENFLTDTNLVCYACEKLFQPIEDGFKLIYDKMLEHSQDKSNKFYELNSDESLMAELFISMNIWRASNSEKFNFKLSDDKQHCLTQIMYEVFIENPEDKNLTEKYSISKEKYNCLSYLTLFSNEEIINPEAINQNLIYDYNSSNPYFIVVNRLLFFISPNHFDSIGLPKICKGAIDDLIEFVSKRTTKINYISKEQLISIGKNYASEFVDDFKTHLIETYKHAFINFIGRNPTNDELNEMLEISKNHIGEFYDPKVSEQKLFIELSKLLNEKIEASR